MSVYKQRTDLLSTDWLRAAQRPSAIGVVRRRGDVQSDSTHNST